MGSVEIVNSRRAIWVEQTQNGLLLLIVGLILSALPVIRLAGSFLTTAGIVLIIVGRHPFEKRHTTHITIGAFAFAFGTALLVVASVGYILFFFAINFDYPGNNALPTGMVQTLPSFFVLDIVGSILVGSSYVVITYRLQNSKGRGLLWLGFVANIAVGILVFSALNSTFTSHLAASWGVGVGWDLAGAMDFARYMLLLSLLNFVPAIIFTVAIYGGYSRLSWKSPGFSINEARSK